MKFLTDKKFLRFLFIFLAVFAVCYFGTLWVIGVSAPGGFYIPFVAQHLNYVDAIRSSLLGGTKFLLSVFGLETYRAGDYVLRTADNVAGIKMVYKCVGYGVMSFWIAYCVAAAATWRYRLLWLFGGLLLLWIINIIRLSLVLAAARKGRGELLGLDHHTWFNIAAYGVIFLMIYLFERGGKKLTVDS